MSLHKFLALCLTLGAISYPAIGGFNEAVIYKKEKKQALIFGVPHEYPEHLSAHIPRQEQERAKQDAVIKMKEVLQRLQQLVKPGERIVLLLEGIDSQKGPVELHEGGLYFELVKELRKKHKVTILGWDNEIVSEAHSTMLDMEQDAKVKNNEAAMSEIRSYFMGLAIQEAIETNPKSRIVAIGGTSHAQDGVVTRFLTEKDIPHRLHLPSREKMRAPESDPHNDFPYELIDRYAMSILHQLRTKDGIDVEERRNSARFASIKCVECRCFLMGH